MKAVEREPLEQIDYGINYRARNSPQQSMTLKVEGGAIAIAIALLAFGVSLAACILLPQIQAARTEAEIAKATSELTVIATAAQDRAWKSDQISTIVSEQLKVIEIDLAKRGILTSRVDGH